MVQSTLSQSADENQYHHLQNNHKEVWLDWYDFFEYSPSNPCILKACRSASPLSLSWRDKKPRTHTTVHPLWLHFDKFELEKNAQFQAPEWLLQPLHHFGLCMKLSEIPNLYYCNITSVTIYYSIIRINQHVLPQRSGPARPKKHATNDDGVDWWYHL